MPWPGAYEWHEGHTGHHTGVQLPGLIKADAPEGQPAGQAHPHMDAPPIKNDQAAGVGVSTYAQYAAPYGKITPGTKSNLFFYPMHGKLDHVKNLVHANGFQTYYAGGSFGKPDLSTKNYNTKHLMVYDPNPDVGASFGEKDYTDAWRQVHELSHAQTYPELNTIYGEGRRIGKLGFHRTAHEAKRAVHWEWLAAHKQRQLSAQIGIHIPDATYHQELNTVMHDAVHRAVTGKFTEPSSEGFVPHGHKVPLEQAFHLIDDAARNLGLQSPHQLLKKSEDALMTDLNTADKLRQGILSLLKAEVINLEGHYADVRERELRKAESCVCGKSCGGKCSVQKTELQDSKTVPQSKARPDRPEPGSVLPGDKKSKDLSDKDTGSGGQLKKIRKSAMSMTKADVPMAKPPSGKVPGQSPPSMSKPAAPTAAPATAPLKIGGAVNKAELPLAKQAPRLGGKDAMSQGMSNDAAKAGAAAPPPMIPGRAPKLTQEDHARRAADLAAFTPAGAFAGQPHAGATSGPMKAPSAQPSGLDLAPRPSKLASMTAAARGTPTPR